MVPSTIYDPAFKAARKKQWCFGAMSGRVENCFFPNELGWVLKMFAHHIKMYPAPSACKNDSSLTQTLCAHGVQKRGGH